MIPKFRAWLREDKSMNNVECMNFDFEHVFLSGWRESFNIKDIDLMQSTGLKDKNGVEIFEGDILNLESCYIGESNRYKYIVRNEPGSFFVTNGESNLCFRPDYEYEIAGNIYENPELLNLR